MNSLYLKGFRESGKWVYILILVNIGFFLFKASIFSQNIASSTRNSERIINIGGVNFTYTEVPIYDTSPKSFTAFLSMEYARHKIETPYNWSDQDRVGKIPIGIDLVYTKFPFDTSAWITKYGRLMPNRVKSLLRFDPNLKNYIGEKNTSNSIPWRLVAQTNCTTEPLAEKFFHGFVIRYRYANAQDTLDQIQNKGKQLMTVSNQIENDDDKNSNIDGSEKNSDYLTHNENVKSKDIPIDRDSCKKVNSNTNTVLDSVSDNVSNKNITEIKSTEQGEELATAKVVNGNPVFEGEKGENHLNQIDTLRPDQIAALKPGIDKIPSKPGKSDTSGSSLKTQEQINKEIDNEINDDIDVSIDHLDEQADSASIKKEKKNKRPIVIRTQKSSEKTPDFPITNGRPGYGPDDPRRKFVGSEVSPDDEQMKSAYATRAEQEMKIVEDIIMGRYDLNDSIVFKALDRHPEWKDMTVVMDWTGSMYPFGAQLVAWHKKNIDRGLVKHLIIFNDGDDNKGERFFGRHKPLGKAGGVYYCDPDDIDVVLETMRTTMLAGDGGPDLDENDMEACLRAISKFPDTDKLLLIADKDSYVRDIALLNKIKVPVFVIACGFKLPIEPDYLTIAYRTKGGIYDMNDDIDFCDPSKVLKRSTIKIDKIKYVLDAETQRFEMIPRKRFFPF